MLQLECVRMIEVVGSPLMRVSFELHLNGKPTSQFAVFSLQPDFCEVGETFNLTAQDFDESIPNLMFGQLAGSLN